MEVKLDIHTSLLSSEVMYACSLQEGAKKVTYIWHYTQVWQCNAITKPLCTYDLPSPAEFSKITNMILLAGLLHT